MQQSATRQGYSASRIFTGNEWLTDHVLISEAGFIQDIIPLSSLPADLSVQYWKDDCMVPAFIDLQVYGAGGRLLSAYPDANAVRVLAEHKRSGGTAWCMPTVATHPYPVIFQCIDAIRQYWKEGGEGVLGLHVEGPWINPVKRGAHRDEWIFSPTKEDVKLLIDYGRGVIRIITLAPECCSEEVIGMLQQEQIIVSAGHSNASFAEGMNAFKKIPLATHLFNAMSPLHHRAPGLPAAVMTSNAMASIIPDGHHVDFAVIDIAWARMKERLFIITDAVTATSIGHYRHERVADKYESDGILSGSALTMDKAVQKLCAHTQIPLDEALRMASMYPARAIGREHELGKLEKGFSACFTVLNPSLEAIALIR